MKNLKKVIAVALVVSSLVGATAFADTDSISINDRVEQLLEEGYTKIEIKSVLEEGFFAAFKKLATLIVSGFASGS